MKIDLVSDVHLEFNYWNPVNPNNSDVLIMAGDIILIKDFPDFSLFFDTVCKLYKHVVYVVGNHEYYYGDFQESLPKLRKYTSHISNLYILEKESIKIDDVVFIGGTMWTDCNKEDPITMMQLSYNMSDYRLTTNGYSNEPFYSSYNSNPVDSGYYRGGTSKKFRPEDTVKDHKKFISFLQTELDKYNEDDTVVVVTHHAPSYQSVPDKYKHEFELNGGYASNIDYLIYDKPYIKYWVHGHMHEPVNYCIGDTNILSNPRGYVPQERPIDLITPYLPLTFEV